MLVLGLAVAHPPIAGAGSDMGIMRTVGEESSLLTGVSTVMESHGCSLMLPLLLAVQLDTKDIVLLIAGAVIGLPVGVLSTRLDQRINEWWQRRLRERLRSNPHWVAATGLLSGPVLAETLFAGASPSARARIADEIIDRIQRRTNRTADLVRAARLLIEGQLLQSATAAGSPDPFDPKKLQAALEPAIEDVLNSLDQRPQPFEFATCFGLTHLQDGASAYFSAMNTLEENYGGTGKRVATPASDRFLTPISVKDGFVAPMVLVSGLLQQFETEWPQALSRFNAAVGGALTKRTLFQRFELYCWLLWGPSIPACTCMGWTGSFLVLQYGYGDENNSFPLILDGPVLPTAWRELTGKLVDASRNPTAPEPLPFAFACRFTGTLVWGPRYRREDPDYPPVYTVPARDGPAKPAIGGTTIFTGMMLRADSLEWLNEPRRYYSAYFWVMFEVCDEPVQPSANGTAGAWRRLLPIFEHSNIADGDTLLFLKHRLAEKACSTVEQIEREAGGTLRLRYLCASDDPGSIRDREHGDHRFRFMLDRREEREPLRDDTFFNGGQPDFEKLLPIEKHRLRTIMYGNLSPEARTRMFAPPTGGETMLVACDLPEIIEDFYRDFLQVARRP